MFVLSQKCELSDSFKFFINISTIFNDSRDNYLLFNEHRKYNKLYMNWNCIIPSKKAIITTNFILFWKIESFVLVLFCLLIFQIKMEPIG